VDKVLAVITKYEEDLDIIDQTKNGQNGGVRCHYDDGSMVPDTLARAQPQRTAQHRLTHHCTIGGYRT